MDKSSISVLLVDDDPDACAIFQMVMDHHRLPVKIVGDAEMALDYLQSNTPDVVVMDLFLPGLDGYQALYQIRKAALAPGCRVIATTAYYTHDTQHEVLSRGFDGYIQKPFDSTELVAYLQRVVYEGRPS